MTVPPVPVSFADTAELPASGLLTPPVPLAGFAPEEFQARRAALRRACPDGIILARGATEDEVAKGAVFQQNSNFFYLTGITTPGAFLALLPDGLSASVGLRSVEAKTRGTAVFAGPQRADGVVDGAAFGTGRGHRKSDGN